MGIIQLRGIAESKRLKSWKKMEKALRDSFTSHGYPGDVIDEICERMKSHHNELSVLAELKLQLPLGTPGDFTEEQVRAVRDMVAILGKEFRGHIANILKDALTRIGRLEVSIAMQSKGIDYSW